MMISTKKQRIAYVYLPGRLSRVKGVGRGVVPSEFFYGAFELMAKGYDVGLFEAVQQPNRSLFSYAFEKIIPLRYLPVKTHAAIIDAVWKLAPKLQKYDVVIATTTDIAFSLTLLKMVFRLKFTIVGVICGVLNYNLGHSRVFLSRILLNRMKIHLFGEGELQPLEKEYNICRNKVVINYFGIDGSFWKPGKPGDNGNGVLSIGNDAQRDFITLIKSAEAISDNITIVTKRKLPDALPENITVIKGTWHSQELSDVGLRKMYQEAGCVVIPLKQSVQPSGQSVALQAMACGCPAVITKTEGIWDSRYLQHRKNVVFVNPAQPGEIVNAIQEIRHDANFRKELVRGGISYIDNHARIGSFAERILQSI